MSKRVIQWLCDLAEQTKEEIVENDTDGGVGSLVDRVAKSALTRLREAVWRPS